MAKLFEKRKGVKIKPVRVSEQQRSLDFKNAIVELRIKGNNLNEIIEILKKDYSEYSLMTFHHLYEQALVTIQDTSKELAEKTINEHLERYENIYKFFLENSFFTDAIYALKRKEALLHIAEDQVIEFEFNEFSESEENKFTIDCLDAKEKQRLLSYIKKIQIKKIDI